MLGISGDEDEQPASKSAKSWVSLDLKSLKSMVKNTYRVI